SSALWLCISGGSGALRLVVLGLRQPYRNYPSDPQEQKIERKEDDQAHVAAKLDFGDEPDGVGGEIADDHEDDVVGDQKHDEFLRLRGNAAWHAERVSPRNRILHYF